ncbi:MAG: hypothetical protein EPO21_14710 [Chloroflexota bacterium]|nr:MAG: hypothetical protein EPO21_14710 [Chloroflexota bacterium]
MARIYVLGNADAVLGFSLVGIEGHATIDPADAAAHLEELRWAGDVGLILVTEEVADLLRSQIAELLADPSAPLVLEVPDPGSVPELGKLADALKRAMGIPL